MWKNSRDHEKWLTVLKEIHWLQGERQLEMHIVTQCYWPAHGMMSLFKTPKQVPCHILVRGCAMWSWHENMLSTGKTVGQLAGQGLNFKTTKTR